ncbi:hypothetical protein NDR87_30850 [Nocardia sp. CDC159]|uniref:Uncharacterized protein n=1 Tax=Nocardia pulmonis TaxID=2951408 RepID=A0A9X2EGR5_9NOCA|nr:MULTISPECIES: hypothetical protein [Nocardia]MCM6778051.1 hypothetical protein [Nocardia pulmonis]MCM6790778.1 hypothetical protein [Nocardia sp. CDC159]
MDHVDAIEVQLVASVTKIADDISAMLAAPSFADTAVATLRPTLREAALAIEAGAF